MTLARKLEVNVKKNTRQQKTLDCTLNMQYRGERSVVSNRVAQLDQKIPEYLGASPAILEYVIFCHQEDSLWPLSDSSTLKKRFDEIFEAHKYTKAIETIKVLRKKQNEELAKLKITEQHLKEDKSRAVKVSVCVMCVSFDWLTRVQAEKRMGDLEDEVERLREDRERVVQQTREAAEKAQVAWDHHARFESIVQKLNGSRDKAANLESNLTDLKQHMKEMSDSDEELQSILERYEERMELIRKEEGQLKESYNALGQEVETCREKEGVKRSEIGGYQKEKKNYEHRIQKRAELIKDTSRRHGIRGFDLDITDEHVRDFMQRISRMAKDQNRAFEKARQESQDETNAANTALSDLKNRKSVLTQNKESARVQTSNNDREISSLETDLDKVNIDEGGKAMLESSMEDVDRKLQKAKADFAAANWDDQVREAEARLRSLEDLRDKVYKELEQVTKQAGDSGQLNFLQKELKDREKSMETMVGAHGTKLSKVLGEAWSAATLERDYNHALQIKSSEVGEAESQRDRISRELEQIDFKLSTCQNDLKRKVKESAAAENRVKDAIDGDVSEFPEVLSSLQTNRDMARGDEQSFGALNDYYTRCIGTLKDHSVCRLCQRPYKDSKEKDNFLGRLQKELEKRMKAFAEDEIENLESELTKAKAAQPNYDTWSRLENEIPALKSEVASLERSREELLAKVEAKDQIVNDHLDAKRDVEALHKTVQNITKYYSDIGSFRTQIEELANKQKSQGQLRGLAEVQEESNKIMDQARSTQSNLTQLISERDRTKTMIHTLESELQRTKSKLSEAIFQLREKTGIQNRIDTYKSQNNEQRETIRRIDQDMRDISPQIDQAQEKLDDAIQRGNQRVKELQLDAANLSDSLNQLKAADQEIYDYIDQGGEQQLERGQRELQHLNDQIASLEQDKLGVVKDIKKLEQQHHNQDETKRGINDNLRYRRYLRELQAVRADIAGLEFHNAEEDRDRYAHEGSKWQKERSRLEAEGAGIVGTMKTKSDQLDELIADWKTDYANAASKYREAQIRVMTTATAAEDLGRYGGALDKAIMKFHSMKMEEINHIIEELWKKTYQGTDVDTIVIRSDNEAQKGNRSYNYRVCMIKQNAEMDMRGRCSAGQKVLASIIIRLALAECFGVQCGLIALDEPTTNLDHDNIVALAQSLSDIIRVRKAQSNFQLIVITHDDTFLKQMNCADFADEYYRVDRDRDMNSRITKQSIAEVMH